MIINFNKLHLPIYKAFSTANASWVRSVDKSSQVFRNEYKEMQKMDWIRSLIRIDEQLCNYACELKDISSNKMIVTTDNNDVKLSAELCSKHRKIWYKINRTFDNLFFAKCLNSKPLLSLFDENNINLRCALAYRITQIFFDEIFSPFNNTGSVSSANIYNCFALSEGKKVAFSSGRNIAEIAKKLSSNIVEMKYDVLLNKKLYEHRWDTHKQLKSSLDTIIRELHSLCDNNLSSFDTKTDTRVVTQEINDSIYRAALEAIDIVISSPVLHSKTLANSTSVQILARNKYMIARSYTNCVTTLAYCTWPLHIWYVLDARADNTDDNGVSLRGVREELKFEILSNFANHITIFFTPEEIENKVNSCFDRVVETYFES